MGFTRQSSNVNLSTASSSSSSCFDYKKLNILAFGGTLVYVGYLFGSMENAGGASGDAFASASASNDFVSGAGIGDERRVANLRAATASSSWDRIWEEEKMSGKSGGSGDDAVVDVVERDEEENKQTDDSSVVNVVAEEASTSTTTYAAGPIIYDDQEGPVTTISLIGERHSGTNWITDHLEDCFGDQIKVETAFTRFKHWFQFDDPDVRNDSAVVIAMFRDPYDWVEAMRERPHHAHDHIGMEWHDFVSKPWVGPRGPADQEKLQHAKEQQNTNNPHIEHAGCLAGYKFDEVVPCSESDSVANDGYSTYMYELMHDGSSRAYGSIIDLRREKILNFMQVPKFHGVRAFFPQRYEALNLRGTAEFLKELEEVTGLTAKCEPFKGTGVVKHKEVDPEYIRWMNKFVDWNAEGLIGYVPREPSPLESEAVSTPQIHN